jgi:hypothetical protein
MSSLSGVRIGSRVTLLVVLLWGARAIEQFDAELTRITAGVSKKSDDCGQIEQRVEVTLTRLQTIAIQRFKGVVFRCLFGAFLANVALFSVKCHQLLT